MEKKIRRIHFIIPESVKAGQSRIGNLVSHPKIEISSSTPGKEFRRLLKSSRLFVCHFGLSVFDALDCGTPALIFNPTSYHNKLSNGYLKEINLGKNYRTISIPKWKTILSSNKKYAKRYQKSRHYKLLPKIIKKIADTSKQSTCPICNEISYVVHRLPIANLMKCDSCRYVYRVELLPPIFFSQTKKITYNENYFLKEYKDQYGRTYQEDRETIYSYATERLKIIKRFQGDGRLLDIGSALGYFLDMASKQKYQTVGIEISPYASAQTNSRHKIYKSDFLTTNIKLKFNVITLWYVLEHFTNISEVARKINNTQLPGGVLAISTPNINGFSARFNKLKFYKESPRDHYSIFSIKSVLKIFNRLGYIKLFIKQTGIHFNRFKNRFPFLGGLMNEFIYIKIAKALRLGDTIEIYLKKKDV